VTQSDDPAETSQQLPDFEDDPLLDPEVHRVVAQVDDEHPLGRPGRPLGERSPFVLAFVATLGIGVAYELLRAVVAVRQVIVLVVIALFLAIGLNPAVEFVERRGLRRAFAASLVLAFVLLLIGGFLAAAVPPVTRQITSLTHQLPHYIDQIQKGAGPLGSLEKRYHFVEAVKKRVNSSGTGLGFSAVGGVLGLGKAVLSAIFSVLTVFILTIYFLANFNGLKRGSLRLIPRSRRARVGLIADEVLRRIGGYVLGNLATSVVAGVAALIFLLIAGVRYSVALALLVAIFDLIPLVGATIAAIACVLVAFFASIPAGIASIVFFIAYQQFENYVLVPRVMKRTVDVSPLATVVAALIGGTLLGVVGALLAIPAAATISLLSQEIIYPRQEHA
jgi:predicted PurR-regulated permease PerM